MTTLAPPELTRPDAPPFTVWDVYWSTIAPLTSPRPMPRPDYDATAVAVWDEITALHVTSILVAASYPTINVVREGDSVSFPGLTIGGSSVTFGGITIEGDTITVIENPGATPTTPPEVVPLPAAAALLFCAVVALPMTKRMRR